MDDASRELLTAARRALSAWDSGISHDLDSTTHASVPKSVHPCPKCAYDLLSMAVDRVESEVPGLLDTRQWRAWMEPTHG